MAKLTLISLPTCPYVQRAVIALKEKSVPFEVTYVDLQNKPDWFLALSPLGKVPVLKVERPGQDDAVVFESAVILEYIEETTDGPLHPADPLERAQHRSWMEYGSSILGDMYGFGGAADEAAYAAARDVIAKKFARLEGVIGDGPLFAGTQFSYVDAVFGPVFRQLDVMDTARPHGIFDALPKVDRWRKALAGRASVNEAAPSDFAERYLGRLKERNSYMTQVAA